jgi:hypothetical protein
MKTRSALVELLKDNRDSRTFFKVCCKYSAFRLRSQAYRFRDELFRDELLERGHAAPLDKVEDTLFELARQLLPETPAADFTTWAGLLCGDAIASLGERFADLSQEEREGTDLSAAWVRNEDIVAACEAEDMGALREALRSYDREALGALERARAQSGAA